MAGFPGFPVPAPIGGIEPASTNQPSVLDMIREQLGSPPDIQSFVAEAAKRHVFSSSLTSVPLSSSNTATAADSLPGTSLNPDDGVWFEYFGGMVVPNDTTMHLSVVDLQLTYCLPSGQIIVPLGEPSITTLVPRIGSTLAFGVPPLLTARALDDWCRRQFGTSIFLPANQPLQVQLSVSMANNDGAAAHSFTVTGWAKFRIIHGLTEP